MSSIGAVVLEIQELVNEGVEFTEIAKRLGIPVEWVLNEYEEMQRQESYPY